MLNFKIKFVNYFINLFQEFVQHKDIKYEVISILIQQSKK